MRQKILKINNYSIIAFFISSFSLLGIPFINQDGKLPKGAYIIALLFWIALISGIVLQIVAGSMWQKFNKKKGKSKKNRMFLIPIACFFIFLVLTILIWGKNIVLVSVNLALLLFSIEIYFYFKRRCSV
ncbi:MAG: hypothetical protein E7510_09805 [Ruminococcus sp.]|nr:hypothetical protein [Ruminococcus sp.]